MFAGQKPYPTWPQAARPDNDADPGAKTEEVARAKPNAASSRTGRVHSLPIVLGIGFGLGALVFVAVVGILLLRQAAAPRPTPVAVSTGPAALPPLPPLVEAVATPDQMMEPERPLSVEPPPIEIGVPNEASLEAAPPLSTIISTPKPAPPPPRRAPAPYEAAPLPPSRPVEFAPAPSAVPATGYDRWTAVYDISAHTVYLPGGMRLEAHSGLGDMEDDPRFVEERDRGPTPPHLYELTLRESLFHGVQALRLTPIGGGFSFNRVGLLAHPYMLGPNGDSNGCVSFKTYEVFLRAFMSGEVKRLAVVARRTEVSPQVGPLASLRPGGDR